LVEANCPSLPLPARRLSPPLITGPLRPVVLLTMALPSTVTAAGPSTEIRGCQGRKGLNDRIANDDALRAEHANAIDARPAAVDVEAAQEHLVLVPARTTMPLVPEASTLPPMPSQTIASDLVIVTVRTHRIEAIDFAVCGSLGDRPGERLARRGPLHGLTSSPTPETQVRVACAPAGLILPQLRQLSRPQALRS